MNGSGFRTDEECLHGDQESVESLRVLLFQLSIVCSSTGLLMSCKTFDFDKDVLGGTGWENQAKCVWSWPNKTYTKECLIAPSSNLDSTYKKIPKSNKNCFPRRASVTSAKMVFRTDLTQQVTGICSS